MKVFISSTCYDLIDIRAELAAMLTEMGIQPVLSDDKLSDFDFSGNRNSIETCLINVDMSDAVVVILDKRYGPSLGEEFDNLSATHLEYRRAKKMGKVILFYVRDRLEADATIRRRNKDTSLKLSWVEEKDFAIFNFLRERKDLKANGESSNWVAFFTNSIDLKQSVRRKLTPMITGKLVTKAISRNEFPAFSIRGSGAMHAEYFEGTFALKNTGRTSAFDVRLRWENQENWIEYGTIGPSQSVRLPATFEYHAKHGSWTNDCVLTFRSSLGVECQEQLSLFAEIVGSRFECRAWRNHQKFVRCDMPSIELVEPKQDTVIAEE